MKFHSTPIAGCFEIEVAGFHDFRGEFTRTFCQREFAEVGVDFQVRQTNFSRTFKKGTLRGLHYQISPSSEAKIIRVDRGAIFDVCVDLRKDSPTFGQWHGVNLSERNKKMFLLPKGCAHGFQTMEDDCEMIYLHDEFYNASCDRTAHYEDSLFKISWPLGISAISDKDKNAEKFPSTFKGIEL